MGWAVSAFEWVDRRPSAHAAAAAPARRRPARGRPVLVDLLAGLAGIGLGITIGLAVTAESAGSLSAPGGVATALGRLSGLLAAYAMVVVVLLVARVPPLERAIGQDRLVGWHRRLGPWPLYLLLAHALLITVGYARQAHAGVLYQFGQLVWTYPGILAAAADRSSCSQRASRPTASRAAGWPTRRGGRCTSSRTSPCSCRSRTRSTRAPRRRTPRRAALVDGAVGRDARRGGHRAARAACVALAATSGPGPRRHARGAGCRLDPPWRLQARPPARRRRPVLPLAVPAEGPVVAGAPVLAGRGVFRRSPAHHRQGPR